MLTRGFLLSVFTRTRALIQSEEDEDEDEDEDEGSCENQQRFSRSNSSLLFGESILHGVHAGDGPANGLSGRRSQVSRGLEEVEVVLSHLSCVCRPRWEGRWREARVFYTYLDSLEFPLWCVRDRWCSLRTRACCQRLPSEEGYRRSEVRVCASKDDIVRSCEMKDDDDEAR